jgi:hypothetical protein
VFLKWNTYTNEKAPEQKDGDYCPTTKTRLALETRTSTPGEFLIVFEDTVREYQYHKFVAIWQTHQEQELKTLLLDGPPEEKKIIVDMDFAENYTIEHKVEIQSEYWVTIQVTLFIVVVHYRVAAEDGGFELVSEAHVGVSSDLHHDTHFVQHFMSRLSDHLKERGLEFDIWNINTDGAASHFKNRSTFFSLFDFKKHTGASEVMWETCAPGHGKGPWDGIGAVIKRLLRRLELLGKITTLCARHVFDALMEHESQWKKDISSRYTLASLFFHYTPVLGEDSPMSDGVEEKSQMSDGAKENRVWDPIIRPKNPPNITAVTGCRSHFCFRVADDNVLAIRELSCRCVACLARKWNECTNKDQVGEWTSIRMESVASGGVYGTRSRVKSQRQLESERRQQMAQDCQALEYVALESKDDTEGFPFWLAQVTRRAWKHTGAPAVTVHGVQLKKGGWYIEIQFLERFPATSETMFRADPESPWVIDAEGVVAREVQVSAATNGAVWSAGLIRRSRKATTTLFRVTSVEVARLSKAAEAQLS